MNYSASLSQRQVDPERCRNCAPMHTQAGHCYGVRHGCDDRTQADRDRKQKMNIPAGIGSLPMFPSVQYSEMSSMCWRGKIRVVPSEWIGLFNVFGYN